MARADGLVALQREVAGPAYDDDAPESASASVRRFSGWLRRAELALETGLVEGTEGWT